MGSRRLPFLRTAPAILVVLHRVEIMRKEGPFGVLRDSRRAAAWEYDLLRFLGVWARRPITLVIDKMHALQMHGANEDPYRRAMHYMLQRYKGMLTFYLNGTGDVLFEVRGKNEDRRLAEAYTRFTNKGTTTTRRKRCKRC